MTRTSLIVCVSWLALLNLAALRAPVAPSAYVVVPALWMLALLATESSAARGALRPQPS